MDHNCICLVEHTYKKLVYLQEYIFDSYPSGNPILLSKPNYDVYLFDLYSILWYILAYVLILE